MDKILKFLNKYWIILSVCATILSAMLTGVLHMSHRIDSDEAALANTTAWVKDHDDSIDDLHDDVLKLKEDERLREAGLLK